jgi:hypothetical protein
MTKEIKKGDKVRSYDFGKEHPECYIEGTVEEIGRLLEWVVKLKNMKNTTFPQLMVHESYSVVFVIMLN